MARLKKLGKVYYIYQDERVYFDPNNPPMGKTQATHGKIPVRVQRALKRGWNYYYSTVWHNTGETVGWLAEKKLDAWNKKYASSRSNTREDVLLRVAIEHLGEFFKASPDYAKSDRYVLGNLSKGLGAKSLGSMRVEDWDKYSADESARGILASTIQRRLNVLRTIYRESKRMGFYVGTSPFEGMKARSTPNDARQISLELDQQAMLLKACYDPQLVSIYRKALGDQGRVDTLSIEQLEGLGYSPDQFPVKKFVGYMKYQSRVQNLDPQTLKDMVKIELVFGLRLAEIIGKSTQRDGKWETRIGLRVGNYDPAERTLVVTRSKQKRDRAMKLVNRKTVFPVPDAIAEILERHCAGKESNDLIFTRKSGEPFEAIMIWRSFGKAAIFSGIKVPIEDANGLAQFETLTFRDLRHVATSNMVDSGMDPVDVARYLGHSSSHMLEKVYFNTRTKGQMDRHREGFGQVMERLANEKNGLR